MDVFSVFYYASAMEAILVVVFVLIAIGAWAMEGTRSGSMLDAWARREGVSLVSSSRAIWPGPFWLRSGKGHTFYRITVRDKRNRERNGFARCGGWFGGVLFSDQVEVVWESEWR